ncbi:MAG: hypothetical protein ACE5LC_07865 [Candidatus Aminicenantales bacterium]
MPDSLAKRGGKAKPSMSLLPLPGFISKRGLFWIAVIVELRMHTKRGRMLKKMRGIYTIMLEEKERA